MAEIIISETYHPKDPETGKLLPTRAHFTVEGLGAGLAEVYHPKEPSGAYSFRLPEVRVIFMPTPKDDLAETPFVDETFTDENHSSLTVVSTPDLLRPRIEGLLGLLTD